MKTVSKGIILQLLLILFAGCSTDKPDDLLKEQAYLEIFAELAIINQMRDDQITESREYLSDQVFERHNATREQFNRTHHYYQRDADAHLARIEYLEKKLSDERAMIQAVIDSVENEIAEKKRMKRIEVQEDDSL